MKPIQSILAFILCLSMATSAFAAESYVCIAGKITWFTYDKNIKQCLSTTKESYNIYLVERVKSRRGAEYIWEVRKPGEAGVTYLCDEEFSEIGYLFCSSMGDFFMNKHNQKYLISYLIDSCDTMDNDGKVTPEEGGYVPYVEIGRCYPL